VSKSRTHARGRRWQRRENECFKMGNRLRQTSSRGISSHYSCATTTFNRRQSQSQSYPLRRSSFCTDAIRTFNFV
ncbi:hypothetical protein L1887_26761, partial [Cichorium endivia]